MDFISLLSQNPNATKIAIGLAFISAISHAIFGALQKNEDDPFLVRAAIDFWFVTIWLPIAIFILPWPTGYEWLLIAGVLPIHTAYKMALVNAYRYGDYSFIYPIARGSSPFFTAILGYVIFKEELQLLQWIGIVLISGAIITMGIEGIRKNKTGTNALNIAITFALLTGAMITAYSIYDTFGVRESRSPLIFLAWFYIVDGWLFPTIAWGKRKKMRPVKGYYALSKRGLYTSVFGIVSFTAIFVASDFGRVGEIFSIRETSVVFAAIIGAIFLREKVTPLRFVAIAIMAFGAILINIGSLG